MNANELADELAFKHIAGDDSGAFSSKIITMLRQQQSEIEALHKEREGLCVFCVNRAILRKAQEK